MNPFSADSIDIWSGVQVPPAGNGCIWYPLNRSDGQQQDFGSGNWDIAAPTGPPGLAAGFFGPAAKFSSGNYFRSTNGGPYLAKNWTLSAWVTTTDLTGTQIIICRGSGGGTSSRSFNMYLNATTGTVVVLFTTVANNFHFLTSVTGVAVNIPTHVAGTYDGANLRVYINGAQDNSSVETGTPENVSSTVGVGTYGSNTTADPFVGTIYDMRVYDRTLQAAEVNALFNSSFSSAKLLDGGRSPFTMPPGLAVPPRPLIVHAGRMMGWP